MIKILAVGNSFSQDATHYLHQIAAADGVEMKVVNLYIGGCSLKQHAENIESGAQAYLYEENGSPYLCEKNGEVVERYVSVLEALQSDEWDFVITQQVSQESGMIDTFYPYIDTVADYLKRHAPQAELLLHETWAYEIDSLHGGFLNYHQNQEEMYQKVSETYKTVASRLGVRIIPSGDAVQALRKKAPFVYEDGGMSLCRDGFHMNLIYGRYLLAAVWYKTLTGNSVTNNIYVPSTKLAPNAVCREHILNVVKQTVEEVL